MKFLLSGEGPSDLGTCTMAEGQCDGVDFRQGPMVKLIIQYTDHANAFGYSLSDFPDSFVYIGKTALEVFTKAHQPRRMNRIRSKKTGAETRYFYDNAKSLGTKAKQLAEDLKDIVIAIFFRDVDGTNSSPGQWENKVKSVQDGFIAADFSLGVPMLPKPKSEAWLICIATGQAGNSCEKLEALPGNDDSPNNAKAQLDAALGHHLSADQLADWVINQPINFDRLRTMPSFQSFEESLIAAIEQVR